MARSPSADDLARVPLFSALSKRDLQEVLQASDQVEYAADDEIVTEGRVGREFFLILEGEARVTTDGKEITTLGAGDYFGELSLLDKGPRTASVVAATDLRVLVLGQREFAGLVDSVSGLAARLLPGLARRLREVDAQTVD